MTPSKPSKFLIVAAGTLACLLSTQTARADLTLNTVGAWDNATNVAAFGPLNSLPYPDTPTYGETFTAQAGNTVLNSFTFYVGSSDGATDNNLNYLPDAAGDQYTVQGEVYSWSGSLYGGNGPQGTTGPALFTSPAFTITSIANEFDDVTVSIAGGLDLTAGSNYVIDLTDIDPTGPSNGDFGIFELVPGFTNNVADSGGGGFNFNNGPSSDSIWDDGNPPDLNAPFDFGDLVFQADFSSTPNNSVPDGACTAILLGLSLASLAILPRRRRALVRV